MAYPTKEQLESKWWHRLIRVLVILATIVSFIFSIFVILISSVSDNKFILSFEKKYDTNKRQEISLKDGEAVIDAYSILGRIEVVDPSEKTQVNVWTGKSFEDKLFTPKEFIELRRSQIQFQDIFWRKQVLSEITERYPHWRIKIWKDYHYEVFLVLLLAPITYFGLWLFYKKVILYIVFGKK